MTARVSCENFIQRTQGDHEGKGKIGKYSYHLSGCGCAELFWFAGFIIVSLDSAYRHVIKHHMNSYVFMSMNTWVDMKLVISIVIKNVQTTIKQMCITCVCKLSLETHVLNQNGVCVRSQIGPEKARN